MERVVFIHTSGSEHSPHLPSESAARRYAPEDLVAERGGVRLTAETPIALRAEGPFEPLARALEAHGPLRDELASAIPIPSLRDHRRTRLVLLAATALPMAALIELDRTLLVARAVGLGRLLGDALLVGFVVAELLKRTPRMPAVAAIALVAVSLRWASLAARTCGAEATVLVALAAAIPAVSGVFILTRVPSRRRVTIELLGKLGITRSAWLAATRAPEPPSSLVAAAVACAAGLPATLYTARTLGAGLGVQALACLAFAALAPALAHRAAGLTTPEPSRQRTIDAKRIAFGVGVGLTLSVAAACSGRLFFDVGADLAHCVSRLDAEARLVRLAEAAELAKTVAKVRASTLLLLLSSIVFPLAEERIYRGLLQEVLVRRWGPAYGIFAASFAFGIAHLGIYEVALYQTVLLGIGFGLAYAEGGLVAAVLVHCSWNVLQVA